MSLRTRTPSREELSELVRQLCGEGSDETEAWMKLDAGEFEPFIQAEDVRLLESPAMFAPEARFWMEQAMDALTAESGRVVRHFLLYIGSYGYSLSLEMLSEIVTAAQTALDMDAASFVVGYRPVEDLKAGEVTLLVLASVGPEPQPGI